MEPIVNPWFIYALSVADGIKGIFIGFMIISIVFVFVTLVIWLLTMEDPSDRKGVERFMERVKIKLCGVIGIICLVIVVLFPTRNTIVGMYVASHLTKDTLTKIGTEVDGIRETIKGDVIDIIEEIIQAEESSK